MCCSKFLSKYDRGDSKTKNKSNRERGRDGERKERREERERNCISSSNLTSEVMESLSKHSVVNRSTNEGWSESREGEFNCKIPS